MKNQIIEKRERNARIELYKLLQETFFEGVKIGWGARGETDNWRLFVKKLKTQERSSLEKIKERVENG